MKKDRHDDYIPLMDRFKAWWEGLEPEAVVRAKAEDSSAGVAVPQQSNAAIEVDLEENEGPLKSWPDSRLSFCRRLWGEEHEVVRPGGTEFTVRLVRPMALKAENSFLDLSAGLGGGPRQVYKELGIWVTGLERNPELAAHAAALSRKHGLDRKVPITAYDPDTLSLKPSSFDGVLVRETLYAIPDRDAYLAKIADAIRPFGHLVLTDLMLADEKARADRTVGAWLKRDIADASPEVDGAYTERLEELGFDVRIEEDESDIYHSYVLQGWAQFVGGLTKGDLDRDLVSRMMVEAEYWVYLMRALQSRKVRLFRIHAIKKPPA